MVSGSQRMTRALIVAIVGGMFLVTATQATERRIDALAPFWNCRVASESALLVSEGDEPASAPLMFSPIGPVALTIGNIRFVEGKDYRVDRKARRIIALRSRLPVVQKSALRVSAGDAPDFLRASDGEDLRLFLDENGFFNRAQVTVTYRRRADKWPGMTPTFSPLVLPRTIARLGTRIPLKITLLGYSISEGYNASAFLGAPPMRPNYADQVADALRHVYSNPVLLANMAHAGWTSSRGLAQVMNQGLVKTKPDLVIIAFGMNDALDETPDVFAANIAAIMSAFSIQNPHTEFILVSPMLPNPNWAKASPSQFFSYRDKLRAFQKPSVAVADLTSIWATLLSRKSYYDITGNGVNHPNDFGHSLSAQALLSLLVPPHRMQLC